MSTLKINTLSNLAGSQSTPVENAINGSAKAWVNFNGTGTVAIRASYNVSSITDNTTGQWTVNFANAMPDTNYVVNVSSVRVATWADGGDEASTFTTGSVRVVHAEGTTPVDTSIMLVSVFR
jgi:hypothetical protein